MAVMKDGGTVGRREEMREWYCVTLSVLYLNRMYSRHCFDNLMFVKSRLR